VGLVGPAAKDAARGVLIAALLPGTGAPDGVRVVTTEAALAVLVGTAWSQENVPGLVIGFDLDDAVAAVEDLAMARAVQVANHADPPDVPRTVLLAHSPTDPPTVRRLRVLLALTADKPVTGVLLGAWAPGTTWRVESGGLVDILDGPPARLSVLGPAATGDLLTVYREAHTPRPAPPQQSDFRELSSVESASPVRLPRQIPTLDGQPLTPAAGAAHQADRVRLTVLGPPAVYPAGETDPVRWGRSAALPVLVFLAVHPAGATSTTLAGVLWPQLQPSSITNRVYNVMSTIRGALGTTAGGPVFLRDADRYRLNPQLFEVDLWRLHDAIRTAGANPDPAVRAAGLWRVIGAYTGELADGWAWPWLDRHREATRRHVLDAYATLAADEDDPAAAARLLRAAARVDPENDELCRRLADTDPHPQGGDDADSR
jgi:DNA-binding SARP family transcriptional activator